MIEFFLINFMPFFAPDPDPGAAGGAPAGGGDPAPGGGDPPPGSVIDDALKQQQQQAAGIPEWAKNLSEDLQKDPNVTRYADLDAYVKGQNELRKAFDGKIPGDDATPEQRQTFWGPLGTPATADGYKIEKPSDLPEGMGWNEEKLKVAAELAHSVNMPQNMFEAMVKLDTQNKIDELADRDTAAAAVVEENRGILKKLWGGAFDQKVLGSGLAVKAFASDDLYARMEAAGLNSDPLFLEYNNEIAKGLSEGKRIQGGQPASVVLTPEEAGLEQKALTSDEKHPLYKAYYSKKDPDHQKALDEFARLGQLKRGKTPGQ